MNRDDVVEALTRQCDNMAFVLNNATLPSQWYDKFTSELEADRATLASLPEAQPEEARFDIADDRDRENAVTIGSAQPEEGLVGELQRLIEQRNTGNSSRGNKMIAAWTSKNADRILTALSRNHDKAKIEAFRALAEMEAIERTKSVNFAELRRRIMALRTALKGDSK